MYTAQFYLRIKLGKGHFATVAVETSSLVMNTNMGKPGDWYQVNVPFESTETAVSLKVEWTGIGNLDVGPIRIR